MKQFKNMWEKFMEGEKFRDTPRSLKDIMESLPESLLNVMVVTKRDKKEGDGVHDFDVYEITNSSLVFRIKKLDWKLLEKNGVKVNGFKLSSDALELNNLDPMFGFELSEKIRESWVSVPSVPGASTNDKRFYYVYDVYALNVKEQPDHGMFGYIKDEVKEVLNNEQ